MEFIVNNFNYWIYVILMMIGLFAMIAKNNLIKKLVGMTIFQTAIILFYVSIGVKGEGATIPILSYEQVHGTHHVEEADHAGEDDSHHAQADLPEIDARTITNPIPHVLMLTAIVVGVATLGVALAISQRIFHFYGSLDEDVILAKIQKGDG